MQAPYLRVGLWDPEGSDAEMVESCARSLERSGARVTRTAMHDGRPMALFSHHPALSPPGEELSVQPARETGGDGALVEIVLSADYFEEHPRLAAAKAWARMRDALETLLAGVSPMLVVCPVEFPVDELADPPDDAAEYLFPVGWVNPGRLDERRRRRFDEALRDGPRSDLAGGWWWSGRAELDPEGRGAEDPAALARAVHTAWTGRPAGAPADQDSWSSELPAGLPELWFWSADRDDAALLSDVSAWVVGRGRARDDTGLGPNGEPGWFPVVVELDPASPPDRWLDELRAGVAAVRPSWAGLLPESGIAVPGLAPDLPSTGVVNNLWVDDRWIGERRQLLDAALEGAYREAVAGGTLYVTDPELLSEGTIPDWCYDPAVRWDRLVDAAAVLAAQARASRP